jgi:hypothetical protein
MEQPPITDTSPPEMPQPPLGEAMSKLLESMDPQGLLNEADQEDGPTDDGVDHSKKGYEHVDSTSSLCPTAAAILDPDPGMNPANRLPKATIWRWSL